LPCEPVPNRKSITSVPYPNRLVYNPILVMKFPIRMFESSLLPRLLFFIILISGVVIADSPLNETPTDILLDNNSVAGTVYVGFLDHKVYAIDGETGEKTWEFETGRPVGNSQTNPPDNSTDFSFSFNLQFTPSNGQDSGVGWNSICS
jgi:hypothetical protein